MLMKAEGILDTILVQQTYHLVTFGTFLDSNQLVPARHPVGKGSKCPLLNTDRGSDSRLRPTREVDLLQPP